MVQGITRCESKLRTKTLGIFFTEMKNGVRNRFYYFFIYVIRYNFVFFYAIIFNNDGVMAAYKYNFF